MANITLDTSGIDGSPHDSSAQIMEMDREYVMGTYARQEVVFVRGQGTCLWDAEGKEYLDFVGGIAVVQVGHCHPAVVHAITHQARTLMHVSNLYHNPLQAELARKLCHLSGMEKAFFCNSGTEAVECALKIARKWGKQKRGAECVEIVTFRGSFHGRTFGAVSATAQEKYQAPFAPVVPGFRYAHLNDIESVKSLVSDRTCAVMVEPIQGEGGVRPADHSFLRELRALCDEAGVLFILDEIQCGMGRTGTFLASQGAAVQGDIVTMAKGIADGVPMGCCLARGDAATTLVPGDHGSTFAGQPLACAAALATIEVVEEERLMEHAVTVGAHLAQGLRSAARASGGMKEVRGAGLMLAVELASPVARAVVKMMLSAGVVVNATGDTAIRLVPPLNVTTEECDRCISTLTEVLASLGA